MIQTLTHYASLAIAAPVNDLDVVPPANQTYVIKGISYAIPQNNLSRIAIYWDGSAISNIKDASYNSKFVSLEMPIQGNGVKVLKLRLDNTSGLTAVVMGVTVYYEKNG